MTIQFTWQFAFFTNLVGIISGGFTTYQGHLIEKQANFAELAPTVIETVRVLIELSVPEITLQL